MLYLCVADVEVAVGLRREPRHHSTACPDKVRLELRLQRVNRVYSVLASCGNGCSAQKNARLLREIREGAEDGRRLTVRAQTFPSRRCGIIRVKVIVGTCVLAIRMTRPSLNVTVVCTELLALGGGKNAYGSAGAAMGCSAVDSRPSAGAAAVPFWTPLLTGATAVFAFAQVESKAQLGMCSHQA